MEKLVSIIIPAYNSEKYIEKTIRSILEQTYTNIEILLINDGSTDQTMEVISKFNDSRIIVINKQNTGVSDTRNCGINIAQGSYITFCDSDDYMDSKLIELLVKTIEETNSEISCCGCMLETPSKNIPIHGTNNHYEWNKKESILELLNGDKIEPSSCGKLFKRNIIKDLRFKKGLKYSEDLLFDLECFFNSDKVVFTDVPLYHYILHANSSTTNANPIKRVNDVIFVREESVSLLENKDFDLSYKSKSLLLTTYLGQYNSLLYFKGKDENILKNKIRTKIKLYKKDYKKIKLNKKNIFYFYGIVYFPHIYKYIYLLLKKIVPDRRIFKL